MLSNIITRILGLLLQYFCCKFQSHVNDYSESFEKFDTQLTRFGSVLHNVLIRNLVWCKVINSLRPRQNGRYNADDNFKCIFLNKNVWFPTKISLKFVPKGPINNIQELILIMAWRRPGDEPLSEPMMVRLPTHICVTRPQWVKSRQSVASVLALHWNWGQTCHWVCQLTHWDLSKMEFLHVKKKWRGENSFCL